MSLPILIALFACISLCLGSSIGRFDCDISKTRCKYIPDYTITAVLSERDVSYNITVDQVPLLGFNASSTVFKTGYTTENLNWLGTALDFGYQAIDLDIYYYKGNWQLCPGIWPVGQDLSDSLIYLNLTGPDGNLYSCQPNVTLTSVASTIADYFDRSDRELTANLILLNLHLHSLEFPHEKEELDSRSIGSYFPTEFIRRLYHNTSEVQPTLSAFLFDLAMRVMVTAKNESLSRNANYTIDMDSNTLYTDLTSYIDYRQEFGVLATDMYTICPTNDSIADYKSPYNNTYVEIFAKDNDYWTNRTLRHAKTCGLTAMFSEALTDYDSLTKNVINSRWSWAPNEPFVSDTSVDLSSDGPSAFKCAQFTSAGWVCSNCYDEFRALCRSTTNSSSLSLSETKVTYFDATDACPENTVFHVPRTPREQRIALATVNGSLALEEPVWIDWNCIAVDGCWVTGGSLASCPYHRYNVNRNGVALISVVAVVSFLLLCISLFLMLDRVPIRHHQAKWKRLYNKFAEQEYEGVPA